MISRPKPTYVGGWTDIDSAFTYYVLISAAATLVQYPTGSALVNQVGYLWDYLLGYLLIRTLIQEQRDVYLLLKCFAGVMVIVGAAMVYEQVKVVNLFGMLGGVAAVPVDRAGRRGNGSAACES